MVDNKTLTQAKRYANKKLAGVFDAFDVAKSYTKGEYVIYKNSMYYAKENVSAGQWDATKWQLTNLSEVAESLRECIKIKGIVPYYKDLPQTGNQPLDAYLVAYEGSTGSVALRREYVWFNGTGTYEWWSFEGNSARAVNGIYPDPNGNVILNEVPYASNLTSDVAQTIYENFISRTSGGTASLSDGDGWVSFVKGNSVHTGVQDASATGEVTTGEFTATINVATFAAAMVQMGMPSGTYPFVYNDGWYLGTTPVPDMSLIGIAIDGTVANGDTYTVTYVQASRGTITNATPTKFVASKNNLYNNSVGYAKVAPYEGNYGIQGTYTSIGFASTPTGTVTPIEVTGGYFTTNGEAGYIVVTGGSTDTMIWQCWSDMTTTTFEAYVTSEITFPTLTICPNGYAKVGTVQDEVNFDTGVATQYVGVLTYTAEHLAQVIAMGVSYDADENYIYYPLATPLTETFSTSGAYEVKDHGIEYFEGTTIPVYINCLYGENLKDKLRTDVVTLSSQGLTVEQSVQVGKNIGLITNDGYWETIRRNVRKGLAPTLYPVGTQFRAVQHTNSAMWGSGIVWEVVDINNPNYGTDKPNIVLMSKQLSEGGIQFDTSEAFYYAEKELPAGTYNFTLPSAYSQWAAGTYQFTLTSALPIGGQLAINGQYSTALTSLKVTAYANRFATSPSQSVNITSGNGGTSLGSFDKELNHTYRISYGSNNYKESALRQWLNSCHAAGYVYEPKSRYQRTPSWISNQAGFLKGLPTDFLDVVGDADIQCSANNNYESPFSDVSLNSNYRVRDKFFLPSRRELFGSDDVVDGTSQFAKYVNKTDADRIKYKSVSTTTPYYWWLRTPHSGSAVAVRLVDTTGAIGSVLAYNAFCVCPACLIY